MGDGLGRGCIVVWPHARGGVTMPWPARCVGEGRNPVVKGIQVVDHKEHLLKCAGGYLGGANASEDLCFT